MTRSPIVLMLAAAAVLVGCNQNDAGKAAGSASPAAATAAPAGTSWTETVSKTPDGGYVMGNPNAPVKLVEYASLTCSHCADFSKTATAELKDQFVAKGTVSYEVRNYVRDPIDLAAALLSRCGGPGPYFAITEQMFTNQPALFAKMQALGEAGYARIQALPPEQIVPAIAKAGALDEFVQQRGIAAARANACLTDKAAIDELIAMNDRANKEIKIQGTPTFLINGETVTDAGTWEALKPRLIAAGA